MSAFGFGRHIVNYRNQQKGIDRFVSGVPFVGPLVFALGWYISPLEFNPWVLLIFILETETILMLILGLNVLYSKLRSINCA